jgi:hypothetical protein
VNFENVEARPEPTALFKVLSQLDYRLPVYAANLLRHVLDALAFQENVVLDVCSSYGMDAALLNHRLTLSELYSHYDRDESPAIAEYIEEDRRFFAERRRVDEVPVIGVDVSVAALSYAISVGLLQGGVRFDLDRALPDADDPAVLARSTVICVGGGTGQVLRQTLLTLVGASTKLPVITGLFPRSLDIRPVAQSLSVAGYEFTADANCVYPRERFATTADQKAAVAGLQHLALPLTATEVNGYHGAVPFVAVPKSLRHRDDVTHALSLLGPPAS